MLTGVIRECSIKIMSSNVSSSIDDTFTKIISPHKNTLFRVYKTLCTASLYGGANNWLFYLLGGSYSFKEIKAVKMPFYHLIKAMPQW
jgi:hypothetical protein